MAGAFSPMMHESTMTMAEMTNSVERGVRATLPRVCSRRASPPPARMMAVEPKSSSASTQTWTMPDRPLHRMPPTVRSRPSPERLTRAFAPGSVENGANCPERTPTTAAHTMPTVVAATMSPVLTATATVRSTGTSMSRALASSSWEVACGVGEPLRRPPSTSSATTVSPEAAAAYLSLERTTPGTSTPCDRAEQIVVSETGARLSPSTAPEMMVPASRAGSQPRAMPAG